MDELREALRSFVDDDSPSISLDEVRTARRPAPSGLNGKRPSSRSARPLRSRPRLVLGAISAAAAVAAAVIVVGQTRHSGPDRITEVDRPAVTDPTAEVPATSAAGNLPTEPFGATIEIGTGTPLDTGSTHQAVLTTLAGTFEGDVLVALPVLGGIPPRVAIGWFEGSVSGCGTGGVGMAMVGDAAGQVRWEVLGGLGTGALQHLAASGTGTWSLSTGIGTLDGQVDCDAGGPDRTLETTLIGPPPIGEPTPPLDAGSQGNVFSQTPLSVDPTVLPGFPGIDFIDGEADSGLGAGITAAVVLQSPDGDPFRSAYLGEHLVAVDAPCAGFGIAVVLIQHFLAPDYVISWGMQPDLSGGVVGAGTDSASVSQGAMRCP